MSSALQCLKPVPCKHRPQEGAPCGDCLPCRITARDHVASRAALEALVHKRSGIELAFQTFTLDDEHLTRTADGDLTLRNKDFRAFCRIYRDEAKRRYGARLRILACGEYGDQLGRPHFHAIPFGIDVTMAEKLAGELWNKGHVHTMLADTIHAVRYLAKDKLKLRGDKAEDRATRKAISEGHDVPEPHFLIWPRKPRMGKEGCDIIVETLTKGIGEFAWAQEFEVPGFASPQRRDAPSVIKVGGRPLALHPEDVNYIRSQMGIPVTEIDRMKAGYWKKPYEPDLEKEAKRCRRVAAGIRRRIASERKPREWMADCKELTSKTES